MADTPALPAIKDEVINEMKLTEDEAKEFNKILLTVLASSTAHMFIDAPEIGFHENQEYIQEYYEHQAEYEAAITAASPRVLEAMVLYFRKELKRFGVNDEPA